VADDPGRHPQDLGPQPGGAGPASSAAHIHTALRPGSADGASAAQRRAWLPGCAPRRPPGGETRPRWLAGRRWCRWRQVGDDELTASTTSSWPWRARASWSLADSAPPRRPGVGGDLVGGDADSADDRVKCPAARAQNASCAGVNVSLLRACASAGRPGRRLAGHRNRRDGHHRAMGPGRVDEPLGAHVRQNLDLLVDHGTVNPSRSARPRTRPCAPRCSPRSAGGAVERRREESRCRQQDRVRSAQLSNLPLETPRVGPGRGPGRRG
jgi:hypothetical protein